ncbi:hypothetical protein KO504_01720 [Winogradskyella psychrotolerans]|uniref:hypothetical protein n=1 Tax=Winogradskyella psychrotolerans TaxID=1344585 RepID=UPI001C06EE23|nr:hypothetical protein [Winogradskyella psychrotolerans]MBU2920048.1 hypothetical protein [Winogradskyella psychrotolerans]
MRNYTLIFILLFISLTGNCQDAKLKEIRASYSLGEKTKKLIEQNKFSELKSDFGQTAKLNTLISLIQSEKAKSGEYKLSSDIYFNPDINKYVYTIYSSKWIKTESDWGLNDYLYIVELIIEHNNSNNELRVTQRSILDQNSDLKKWWQSLMDSYNKPKFQRKKWADEYKLVPPPPPPPQTTEWFKK